MAAARKKDFKQGVDYFLSNGAEEDGEKVNGLVDAEISVEQKEQSNSGVKENTHTHTYTYNDADADNVTRPLPAKPKGERKSRRLNLLVRPSMYDSLSMIAARAESSVNDLINNILEDFVANAKKEM